MTGMEWVSALIRLNGLSDAESRDKAAKAIAEVDLTEAADKKIGAYSKGMRQRIKMAQALAHNPELPFAKQVKVYSPRLIELWLAALERGVVLHARDLGKLKTWSQALAAAIGGYAAAGAWSETAGWWALLVAVALTWISGLDYARLAPQLFRSRAVA